MKFRIFINLIVVALVIGQAKAEDFFSVSVELEKEAFLLSELPSFKYEGNDGYYFNLKVSVTNKTSTKKQLMVDDDCTYASWRTSGNLVKVLAKGCRQNVYHQMSLGPGEKYESTLKVWFPKDSHANKINFKMGFVEIADYDRVSGPYWSDVVSVEIKK